MIWPPPDGFSVSARIGADPHSRMALSEIATVEPGLAKNVFYLHRVAGAGQAVLRKKLLRDQVLAFFGQMRSCIVAMKGFVARNGPRGDNLPRLALNLPGGVFGPS